MNVKCFTEFCACNFWPWMYSCIKSKQGLVEGGGDKYAGPGLISIIVHRWRGPKQSRKQEEVMTDMKVRNV